MFIVRVKDSVRNITEILHDRQKTDQSTAATRLYKLPTTLSHIEAGCSQEEGPKKGFVMGSRTRGVQEILEKCM